MDIVLGILRYLFVGTTLVGGVLVMWAIVRLAREKSRHTTAGEQTDDQRQRQAPESPHIHRRTHRVTPIPEPPAPG